MDLNRTPEQQQLADTARAFVADRCPVAAVRRVSAERTGFDEELWRAMAGLGWTGLTAGAEHGGGGGTLLDLVVIAEALGRGPVPSPLLVSTTLAALPIALAGSDAQRDRWLPALATGEAIGTLALAEPGGLAQPERLRMTGGDRLGGTKLLVPWAAAADLIVVATADGLHLVERAGGAAPVERHDDLRADPLFAVTFDATPAERLGAGSRSDHATVLRRSLDHAAVAQLAYLVGAAERTLELTVQHATDRHQFGRPIGANQAVAHRCVDMRTDLDACRYLAYRAAWALDADGPADLAVGSALAYGSEAARRIFVHAHQVHGAVGFSTEHDLHLFTRHAKAFELAHGSSAGYLERVATGMGLP